MQNNKPTVSEVINVLKWIMACRSHNSSAMDFLAANEKAHDIIARYEKTKDMK